MSSHSRSLPAEANDFGVHELLRRHRDTHLVQRQLATGIRHGPFPPRSWSSPSSTGSESQLWIPRVSMPSESSVATRRPPSVFDTCGTQSYATSISARTETDATSLAGSDAGLEQNQGLPVLEEEETIPCEFAGYTHCERRFGLNQIQQWLNHVTGYHLQGQLPRETVCWFCDDGRFVTTSDLDVNKEACLRQRMHHIVAHLRDSPHPNGLRIRPDFPFLEHLANCRLIPQSVIDQARNYSEMPPQYRVHADTARPRRVAAQNVVIENNRSNGRRPRREQQYAY